MVKKKINSRKTLLNKATNPYQYDLNLDWEKTGMIDSPTRQFFQEYLEKNMKNLKDKSVIDIGSGTGYLTKLLNKLGAKDIFGIEPSRKNIEISRELYPEMSVFEGTLENFTADRVFDVVVVVMVFEHIANLKEAFEKIASLIRHNGVLYIIFGDKRYHATERFGYKLAIENLRNGEVAVATTRPDGLMHDIFRTTSYYIKAANRAGFFLKKHDLLIPTQKFMKADPKYIQFNKRTICHLMIFKNKNKTSS